MGARSVAVAVLKAETHGPACDQRHQVGIGEYHNRKQPRQNLERGNAGRIRQEGHFNEILDGTIAQLGPHSFEFCSGFLIRWMGRPVDPQPTEIFEPDLHCARVLTGR